MNKTDSKNLNAKQQPSSRDGIGELVAEYRDGNLKRREFLRRLVAIGISTSAAYSVLNQASAAGQITVGGPTTTALIDGRPEEDVPRPGRPPRGTTFASGEEDATSAMVGEESSPGATSAMVGEESYPQPNPTTYALGEEGPAPPMGTTTMVGEESYPQPIPQPTTYAVGEECNTPRPPMGSTAMIGEEGTPYPSTRAAGEEGTPVPLPSTRAMGEEGTPRPPMGTTTLMMGEESSTPSPTPLPPSGGATTLMVGEESQAPIPIPTNPVPYNPVPSSSVPSNPVPGNSWNGFGRW